VIINSGFTGGGECGKSTIVKQMKYVNLVFTFLSNLAALAWRNCKH